MRAYLDGMEKAAAAFPALSEPSPIALAALGPQMTALGGERTAGVHPYNVTPEHTASARAIIGRDKWLCVEQKCSSLGERRQPSTSASRLISTPVPVMCAFNLYIRKVSPFRTTTL
jgi:hypothetical protein